MRPGFSPFDGLVVVGCGLIGGSLAAAVRAQSLARRVTIIDPDPSVRSTVLELGLGDAAVADWSAMTGPVSAIALCTPPAQIAAAAQAAAAAAPAHAILFDVASVKSPVATAFMQLPAPFAQRAVPCHPIAGTERSGPEAAFATLFEDRWCVITPQDHIETGILNAVIRFWEAAGARVAQMTPGAHDALLAATSHVPHLIAYALTATALGDDGAPRADMASYSAGGFRDFTRIAASDPAMWRDVFLMNKQAALTALDRFQSELSALRAAVASGDGHALEARFAATRAVRAQIVAAGQETAKPNFGRDVGDALLAERDQNAAGKVASGAP